MRTTTWPTKLMNELLLVHRMAPDVVSAWLADETQEVTRPSVRMLRAFIDQRVAMAQISESHSSESVLVIASTSGRTEAPTEQAGPASWVNPVLAVRHQGREGRLLMRRRPSAVGKAWMRDDGDCALAKVELADLELVALMEG